MASKKTKNIHASKINTTVEAKKLTERNEKMFLTTGEKKDTIKMQRETLVFREKSQNDFAQDPERKVT